MDNIINFYCDESCHLENDESKAMVLGTVYCPSNKRQQIFTRLREIKNEYGIKSEVEVKWNKVSKSKFALYKHLIDYFFDDDDLKFRGIVIPDKTKLVHDKFNQTHDQFYYKMYFDLLKMVLSPENSNNIYIDIKDTRGNEKVKKLRDVLRAEHYDQKKQIVKKVQQIRSNEVEIMQLTDLLIGALSYLHRDLNSSEAKLNLIKRIQSRSGFSLLKSTWYNEKKFNILIWRSSYGEL